MIVLEISAGIIIAWLLLNFWSMVWRIVLWWLLAIFIVIGGIVGMTGGL